jgi:ribosomal protein S6
MNITKYNYECMVLLDASKSEDEIVKNRASINELFANYKCEITVFELGQRQLSYPIEGKNMAIYLLYTVTTDDKDTVEIIRKELTMMQKIKVILRYLMESVKVFRENYKFDKPY